jgi:hypothetical protein
MSRRKNNYENRSTIRLIKKDIYRFSHIYAENPVFRG